MTLGDKFRCPQNVSMRGWGLRKPRETRNKALELSLESTLEVTAGLRTLKLHSNGKATEHMSPPPSPQPIQQIDIKLPEGKSDKEPVGIRNTSVKKRAYTRAGSYFKGAAKRAIIPLYYY